MPSTDNELHSHGAQVVRALLERHGLPKHRHSSFVGEFFALSRAAAHQRVSKSTAWTLEELAALAEHFGETLAGVVSIRPAEDGVQATLRMDGVQTDCRVWLQRGSAPSHHDAFIAVEEAGVCVVVPAASAPRNAAIRIVRLEIVQSAAKPLRVAVLDGKASGAAICAQLTKEGMNAVGFESATELLAELNLSVFDAFVLDWPLRRGEATPLLDAIRAQGRQSAIVLLSNRMRTAKAQTADLASAMTTYRAQFLEKPAPLLLLLAALEGGMAH